MASYKIVRSYERRRGLYVVRTGLTLREARRHCRDSETSSLTSTCPDVKAKAKRYGHWFDGYVLDNS